VRCAVCGGRAEVAVHGGASGPVAFCAVHAALELHRDDRSGGLERGVALGAADAASAYDAAWALLREGRAAEAAALLGPAVAREPGRVALLDLLAQALEAAGDLEAAVRAARRAVAAAPAEGGRYAALGRLLARAGDTEGAVAAFEDGFERDAFAFECCRRAAVVRIAGRRAERAVELLRRYLARTARAGPEILPVDAAARPATAADFPSGLAFVEALRPVEERRAHIVAANRYHARILLGDALRSLGLEDEAIAQHRAAPGELGGLPDALLADGGVEFHAP
jgi:tetratricopeptide (TPR) repeat protein